MLGKFRRLRTIGVVLSLLAITCGVSWSVDNGQDFKSKVYEVKGKGKAEVTLSFPVGKEVVATVRSSKKTDIHLFVYDSSKKTVAKDDSPGPNCDVKFTPQYAGNYTFEIENVGPGDNSCTLKVDVAK